MSCNCKRMVTAEGETIELETHRDETATPLGYCRLIDGKPCRCLKVWMLPSGACPCSPKAGPTPIVRNKEWWEKEEWMKTGDRKFDEDTRRS